MLNNVYGFSCSEQPDTVVALDSECPLSGTMAAAKSGNLKVKSVLPLLLGHVNLDKYKLRKDYLFILS